MTTATGILLDGFSRVRESVHRVLDGVTDAELQFRADADSNTIAWLVWHIGRGYDAQLPEVLGAEQLWERDWYDRFGLPFPPSASGYGMSADEVGAVRVSADLLRGYFDAVADRTDALIAGLSDADLDRVVDERWDPPVTLGVRIVSILNDATQHVGQAAYARGIARRAS